MINRRDFLKVGGAATLLLYLTYTQVDKVLPSAVEVSIQGRLYRGTVDGKIYVSTDQGQSWQLQTNLGSDYSILNFYEDARRQVYTKVGYQGYSFLLAASNQGKEWRTVA